jgi:uncharacterized protein (DUF2132 family)
LEVDADKIIRLIEKIPISQVSLEEELTQLVYKFGFDEIIEMMKRF